MSVVWPVATCSATLAGFLSFILVGHYLCRNKAKWALKRCVFVIVLMVPIYAFNARACLKRAADHHFLSEVFTMARELYETLVMIAFVQLVVFWLGGAKTVARAFEQSMQEPQHVWFTVLDKGGNKCSGFAQWLKASKIGKLPFPFFPGLSLVAGLFAGVLQYSMVSLFVCFLNLLIWAYFAFIASGNQDDREDSMLFWMKFPQFPKTVSVGIAFYCLILLVFELERNERLQERFEQINPHSKFWCIKLLVLATALQKVLFETVLPHLGVWPEESESMSNGTLTPTEFGGAAQNWLLCFELLLFAIWHFFAYPVTDFEEEAEANQEFADPGLSGMLQEVLQLRKEAIEQWKMFKKLIQCTTTGEELTDAEKDYCWKTLDCDGDGSVAEAEMMFVLKLTGHNEDDARESFQQMDSDGDGHIEKHEFMSYFNINRSASPAAAAGGLRQGLLEQ